MPATTEADFVDQMVANVALQFLDRVDRSPRREAFRYPVGDRWESGSIPLANGCSRVRVPRQFPV